MFLPLILLQWLGIGMDLPMRTITVKGIITCFTLIAQMAATLPSWAPEQSTIRPVRHAGRNCLLRATASYPAPPCTATRSNSNYPGPIHALAPCPAHLLCGSCHRDCRCARSSRAFLPVREPTLPLPCNMLHIQTCVRNGCNSPCAKHPLPALLLSRGV